MSRNVRFSADPCNAFGFLYNGWRGNVCHPDSVMGGGGPGYFRQSGFGPTASRFGFPDPNSPIGRGFDPYYFHTNDTAEFVVIDVLLLQEIISECSGRKHSKTPVDINIVADALNRSMKLANANTRLREVAFLSQAVIETDFFKTFSEYGGGAGHAYGKYYGRGFHQLTWKDTYAACSKAVFGDDRLLKNPDLISSDIEVNIKTTAWFWRDYKPFNRLADEKNVDEIIHRLYGGKITSSNENVRKSVTLRRGYYHTIEGLLINRAGKMTDP